MTTFSSEMRRRTLLAGLSIRALAATIPVDPSHLARIARGERRPTPELAEAIDQHLDAGGELAALAEPEATPACTDDDKRRPLDDADAERIRATIAQLVSLDTAHGSDGLHQLAARAFRTEADHLAVAGATQAAAANVKAAVAELGEVAAWLAYDAEEQDTSRALATEALLIARMAGDTSMERFLLSHLSMQAVYQGRGAEGLSIADRVLAEQPRSERVRGMFTVRRARALALLGAGGEALDELGRARSVLLEGISPGDPQWTWWLHEAEMAIHEARIRAASQDRGGAVAASQRAVASLPARQGRDGVLYRAWLLRDLVDAHAWREAEQVSRELVNRVGVAGTARVPRIVRGALDQVEGPGGQRVPRWLRDAVRAAAQTWNRAT